MFDTETIIGEKMHPMQSLSYNLCSQTNTNMLKYHDSFKIHNDRILLRVNSHRNLANN